ncbi:hypothetical protein I5Q34_33610 [Streptomyces sp. AV19]|uniref:hypothetical protein n=1 Tax=Streptomyces sp. AV19 TaxID=2793068 RepID=UPI0018FE5051|nr:hypothetical protein [Streptomyces sp. AV19]MBH1939140.1 hypothetical protein [Streptomyces sp. AV19]MDG4535294.1 hypothetical protein [Streptomyces sp. AV19]
MPYEDNEAYSTERSCPVNLKNETGKTVDYVLVTYRFGGYDNKVCKRIDVMTHKEVRENIFTAKYKTGIGTGHCYWFILFLVDDVWFSCGKKYCDLKSEDQDIPVLLSFNMSNFHIGCPESSPCDADIN